MDATWQTPPDGRWQTVVEQFIAGNQPGVSLDIVDVRLKDDDRQWLNNILASLGGIYTLTNIDDKGFTIKRNQ